MRKKIQAMLAALALFIMTVADASCSKCNQQNNKSDFRNCLCNLAGLAVKQNESIIAYVSNSDNGRASDCSPIGSLDCPYSNIADAVAGSPPGAEIRVIYTGNPYVIENTIELKPRQVLKGWGSEKPTVVVSAQTGIILANRSRVLSLVFQAQGDYVGESEAGSVGIGSEGANNATIRDNVFINFDISIYLIPVPGTKNTVKGNTFQEVGFCGIYATSSLPYPGTKKRATKRARTKTSSPYELLIQGNLFNTPASTDSAAIYTLGVGKLTVLENIVQEGYYVGFAANTVPSTGLVDSEANEAFTGISLELAGNYFVGVLAGNSAAAYSKMVIRGNSFSCESSEEYNINAFGISLSAGNTACVTNNQFIGCNGTASAAGFTAMVVGSTGQSIPCLQLTDNASSGNTTGRDYVLNAGSSLPLAINSTYSTMNAGDKIINNLVPGNNCSQCSQ